MAGSFNANELEQFREVVARRLGLNFDDSRQPHLAEVLRRRLDSAKLMPAAYLRQLETNASDAEMAALVPELTVAETYFFRHTEQYRAFTEVALPECVNQAMPSGGQVQVLSAGCASGEEPYSLAIATRETLGDDARRVSIMGVDVNAALLQRARRGRFSSWALRQTSETRRHRWFRSEGRDFAIKDEVRNAVTFKVVNLVDERSEIWRAEWLDVIFCRNVMMYFTPATAETIVGRFARALKPGGYLFLGHAETLRGLSNEFHLRHTHETFYYQRRDHLHDTADSTAAIDAPSAATAEPSVMDGTTSWVDAIANASQRIEALAAPADRSARSDVRSVDRRWEVGLALELLREERYGEALDLLDRFPPESSRDPEVLLLRAVLLTHSGQLVEAERACARLLEIDELHAGAHYLLALCREGARDREGAIGHDRTAIYLDPGFAMAHLHLGLLARRAGDRSTARRELEQAIVLLHREDASRLLLFGGGFRREALTALCRAELASSGGTR